MSYVFELVAPFFGLIFPPSTTHVLELNAPIFGLRSLPSKTQVFELVAPVFGLISLPSNVQVLELEAPLFGLSSRPSQAHSRGNLINVVIGFSRFFNECLSWAQIPRGFSARKCRLSGGQFVKDHQFFIIKQSALNY